MLVVSAAEGPKGRFVAGNTYFWGTWKFSPNKAAGKDLIRYLAERAQAERLVEASQGFDLPSFEKQLDFKTWKEQGPPAGTLANYPPRGDVVVSISGSPAPPHRHSDVRAGHDHQDDRAMHDAEEERRAGDGLGRLGARRLHENLARLRRSGVSAAPSPGILLDVGVYS